ncbi:MAG: hypothetical protein WKG07_03665 [Hymenobacter sp.]
MKEYAKSDAAYDAALIADPANYGVLNNYSYYLSLRGEKLDKAKEMSGRTVAKHFPTTTPTSIPTPGCCISRKTTPGRA